ncbi:hypothetical protein O0I10_005736 [Lichtheimia ornata]|uniref:Velvet domain-containing protein n=1 Tax=Lichtheimia ornata TaxID=688661 RepID=A0AAD7V537_9FUNG|nr:uncharacterized protein O0I10_005736 [Lichtheimia ornata]KAJ8658696.1 hypothetical protein O0I10_005736 [Lichtheimia ornata]
MTKTRVPPPLGLIRPSQTSVHFQLVVVQQPVRARSCGFGEKDKRPIDPPVILQLHKETQGTLHRVSTVDNVGLFVVQCQLYSEDGKHLCDHVFHPATIHPPQQGVLSFQEPVLYRNLLGVVVSNGYQLLDIHGDPGIFFVFQDLSVRTEGRYRLKFLFIDLSAGEPLTMSTQVLNEVFSDPFTVYTPKTFPGMTDSTTLSRSFANQGIKLSIRKEKRIRKLGDSIYGDKNDQQQQQQTSQ